MEIRQLDKMADQDQVDYLVALVAGAEKVLTDEGRPDLALVRLDDAKNAAENPNDPRSEVEDAMAITLGKNHIPLSDSIFTVASNFKPIFPLKAGIQELL